MKNKIQIRVVIVLLLLLGIGSTIYKINVLGFSFSPGKTETAWTVESVITFDAQGGPVKVSLNEPDNTAGLTATDVKVVTSGYTFKVEDINGVRRGTWSADQ
ncbi:MAG: UUP1 family membrane protein, partial [Thermodesulfobacteriota bacterium]|nr:UUP1 family membrane protein [Thermodesulfobacteriota bacterium]